ncbi:ABC transporter ATP-binding protein [Acetivibrio cellulolyticus]|uniref:ABC transporter ATP-binding protein n=1 Tax=Acetivibrio cellulolyticus TaxID=35830 RepID=UPI0001E2D4F7|nr:ABC transporter ATP-binding protein [Acetivibrio cellulolyticus]
MRKKLDSWLWIYGYSKKHILKVVSLTFISALIALTFIGLALLSKEVIDIATGKQKGEILFYFVLFIVLIAFQAGLNIVSSNIRVRASGKIEMNIKEGVFNSLVEKELTELNKYHSGEYINRLTSDIGIVVEGVVSILPQAVSMVVKLVAGLAVLVFIDPVYTLLLIVCGIIVFVISWFYRKKFKALHKEVQQTDGKTRSFMQECVENLVVIKSFTSEKPIMSRLKALQNDNYRSKIKRNTVTNLASTGVYVLFTSSYYFTLVWGVMQVGAGTMTFGSLTAFLQVFEQVKTPFKNISGIIPQYFSMIASVERLQEIENLKNEVSTKNAEDIKDIYEKMEFIKFDKISFTYSEEPILVDASAIIQKGELLAVVGSSGAGKSTLIKLLLGLIAVNDGQIYLKTKETKYNIDAGLRKLFSYVPQGNMILSGTIRENITFFNDGISEQEVINAAQTACVMEFVSELPEGLDTLIGERGIGLSEGQIQRIAIARALTSKAPILLLDEATSALDSVTERELLSNLRNIKNKTCIFISHREATIADCDRVIKIENCKMCGG